MKSDDVKPKARRASQRAPRRAYGGIREGDLFDTPESMARLADKMEAIQGKRAEVAKVQKLKKQVADLDKAVRELKTPKAKKKVNKAANPSGFVLGGTTGSKEMSNIQARMMKNMQGVLDGKVKLGVASTLGALGKTTIKTVEKETTKTENAFLKRMRVQSNAMTKAMSKGLNTTKMQVQQLSQGARTMTEVASASMEVLREEIRDRVSTFATRFGVQFGDSLDDALDDPKLAKGLRDDLKDELGKGKSPIGKLLARVLGGAVTIGKAVPTAYERSLGRLTRGREQAMRPEKSSGIMDTLGAVAGKVTGTGAALAVGGAAAVGVAGKAIYDNAPAIRNTGKRALGWLSKQYESGTRGVATISTGRGDAGGVSYGEYQIASKTGTMDAFLNSKYGAPYKPQFAGAKPGSARFNQIYKQIVAKDGEAFSQAQHAFIQNTHYTPLYKKAKAMGYDVDNPVIANVIWSFGVQHGGAHHIFQYVKDSGINLRDNKAVVQALYQARGLYISGKLVVGGKKRGKRIQGAQGIISGRYKNEQSDALRALNNPDAAAPIGNVGAPKRTPTTPRGQALQKNRENIERFKKQYGDDPGSSYIAELGGKVADYILRRSDGAVALYNGVNAPDVDTALANDRADRDRRANNPAARKAASQRQIIMQGAAIARNMGAIANENKYLGDGRVGKHGKGSYHYTGDAFDVNAPGGVNESTNKIWKSRFDAGAREYMRQGYNVIWNGKFYNAVTQTVTTAPKSWGAHDGHMHVNIPKGGLHPAAGRPGSKKKSPYGFGPHSGVVGGVAGGATVNRAPGVGKGVDPNGPAVTIGRPAGDTEMATFLSTGSDPYSRMIDNMRAENLARAQARAASGSAPAGNGTIRVDAGGSKGNHNVNLALEDQALAALLMQGLRTN